MAIENWEHDLNIGTVVRNANAFLAAAESVVGDVVDRLASTAETR